MRHRLNNLYIIIVALMIGITGCTDTGDTQDAAQTDKNFDQAIVVADSLYNCMQFRDAYKLYLQLLDNKEAEADSGFGSSAYFSDRFRQHYLVSALSIGAGIRQLSRITGVSFGVIQKLQK